MQKRAGASDPHLPHANQDSVLIYQKNFKCSFLELSEGLLSCRGLLPIGKKASEINKSQESLIFLVS
jgi:hypothetical protein